MLLLRGAAPTRAWAPGDRLRLRNDERGLLDRLYAGDPLFCRGRAGGHRPQQPSTRPTAAGPDEDVDPIAHFAGRAARGRGQDRGLLHRRLGHPRLARPTRWSRRSTGSPARSPRSHDAMGPAWDRTLVIAMTEFGRTVQRERQRRHRPRHRRRGAPRRRRPCRRPGLRRLAGALRGRALPGARPDADRGRPPLSGPRARRRSSASTAGRVEPRHLPGPRPTGAGPQFLA